MNAALRDNTAVFLSSFLPTEQFSMAESERAHHAADQSSHPAHLPDMVIWPTRTEEVSRIAQFAHHHAIPITPWGAGSSLEGNPIPVQGGISLSFRLMNQITAVHARDFQVTVQPGILYKDMNQTLAQHGLFFAPDPGANASIGGMLANNAAGIRTVRYGATRDNVLGLEVVLANGDVIRTGSRSLKQSAGYDLTHLIVGSEGTLGIITEATLKLEPIPEQFSAATAAFPTVKQAAQVVYEIMGAGLAPNALELLDETAVRVINTEPTIQLADGPNLFMEFSGPSQTALAETLTLVQAICQEHDCLTYQEAIGPDARRHLWEARHRLLEIHLRQFPGMAYLITDVAVPISEYPALAAETAVLLRDLGLEGSIASHAGDGNLHSLIFFPPDQPDQRQKAANFNKQLVKLAQSRGGTCTGEHGVGLGKIDYMSDEHGAALEVMRAIKKTLDPNNILNPGKIFPARDERETAVMK